MEADSPPPVPRILRRLFSLYPGQVEKLTALARQAETTRSEYLRQLIEVAYVEKIQQPKFDRKHRFYGAKSDDSGAA